MSDAAEELAARIKQLRKLISKASAENDLVVLEQLIGQVEVATDDLRIQQARKDPNAFIEYCFEDKNGPLKQAELHRVWQSEIAHPVWNPTGNVRAMIIAPRDHGKTTQIPVGRALWEIGNDPNLRIKIACQSDRKAVERLFEITDHMERNERVKKVFPHLKPAARGDYTTRGQ